MADNLSSTGGTATTDQPPPLPAGWEQGTTPEGRFYFIDHNTHTTTWDDPRLTEPQMTGPLPSGWEKKRTSNGVLYFEDHNTKSTTWTDPR